MFQFEWFIIEQTTCIKKTGVIIQIYLKVMQWLWIILISKLSLLLWWTKKSIFKYQMKSFIQKRKLFYPSSTILICFAYFLVISYYIRGSFYPSLTETTTKGNEFVKMCENFGISIGEDCFKVHSDKIESVMLAVRTTHKHWWRMKTIHDTWFPFMSHQVSIYMHHTIDP